jgi:hypothetical protein
VSNAAQPKVNDPAVAQKVAKKAKRVGKMIIEHKAQSDKGALGLGLSQEAESKLTNGLWYGG